MGPGTGDLVVVEAGSARGRCAVCGELLGESLHLLIFCPECETSHHRDCWDFAQGCARFGCPSRQARKLPVAAGAAVAAESGTTECATCSRPMGPRGDRAICCARCHVLHHRDCWHFARGCSTPGCRNGLPAQRVSSGLLRRAPATEPVRSLLPISPATLACAVPIVICWFLLFLGM